ncbi:MAG: sugar phosphate isomerase/epimerase, partial [Clostridiales bacterium]|nr:sugar phosphate isomerase/epimerase [Clostridiales bacterium]
MKIGVLMKLTDVKERIPLAAQMGIHSCQLTCWDPSLYTDENAKEILSL